MTENSSDLYAVAQAYYARSETMESIARELGVSRSTVSRMLSRAREQGVVRITLAEPPVSNSRVAKQLAAKFGVKVYIVDVADSQSPGTRLRAVTSHAAQILSTMMRDNLRLGIAWGVTVAQMATQIPSHPQKGVRVVQMNGSVHAQDTGLPYVGSILQSFADAFSGAVMPFPVPAFFDHEETRQAMWRERSVQRIIRELAELDVAVFGVGCITSKVPSHVYSSGYLSSNELMRARSQGAVGDVCTVLLRQDGTWQGIDLNQRASGMTPDQLHKVPRRLCVVGDPSRAVAVLAALRAGVATDLVCDAKTAKTVARLI